MNPTTHVLRPQPPMRAFVLAAGFSVLGALLVVICAAAHAATFWMVVGLVLLAFGVFLVVAALVSMRRLRSFVDLTDEGYTVRTPGRVRSGAWDEVTKVTSSQGGAHLTLYQGQVGRTHILAPGNVAGPEMEALATDIAQRLDHNRGYRSLNADELDALGAGGQPGQPGQASEDAGTHGTDGRAGVDAASAHDQVEASAGPAADGVLEGRLVEDAEQH